MADDAPVSLAEFVAIQQRLDGFEYTPRLHYDICQWIEDSEEHPYRMLQAFREGAKSYISCCYIVWRLLRDPAYTCILISAVGRIASRNARHIRNIIMTNPLTKHLVPVGSDKEAEWRTNQFSVVRPTLSLHPSVSCVAVTGGKTGLHGDETIGDDIEIDTNCRSEEGRQAIFDCLQEMFNLSPRILLIGTPHDEQTIYLRAEYEYKFVTYKRPVWNDPENEKDPAWPEKYPAKWIRARREKAVTGVWKSQYLLIPARAWEAQFDWNLVHIYDSEIEYDPYDLDDVKPGMGKFFVLNPLNQRREQIKDIRAYWDSASGLRNHDDSVVAVVIRSVAGNVYVHETVALPPISEDSGFDRQCEVCADLLRRNYVNTISVERNFSITLAAELKRWLQAKRGKFVRVAETRRTTNKKELIANAIEPLMTAGRLFVHRRVEKGEFKRQLEMFPHSKSDDFIDAVAGAILALSPPRAPRSEHSSRLADLTLHDARTPVRVGRNPSFTTPKPRQFHQHGRAAPR